MRRLLRKAIVSCPGTLSTDLVETNAICYGITCERFDCLPGSELWRLQVLNNFVNGEYAAATGGQTSPVVDPSTGEEYARAPVSGPADVETALRAAAGAFEGWRDTTPAERSLALLRMADAVEARAAEIVTAECRNTGKPVGPHHGRGDPAAGG